MESNPTILTLKTKIQELTRELVGQSVEQTKEHPAYKITEETLETTKEALKSEAEKTFSQQIDRRSDLFDTILSSMLKYDIDHIIYRGQVEHYNLLLKLSEGRMEELITAQPELTKLTDEQTQLSTLLSTCQTNHSNISNIMNKPVPFFRVVSPARIDKNKLKYYKYFPKRKLILALTFMSSLFVLSFLMIAKELYANTFYYGWQLSTLRRRVDYTDVPILGISATNKKSDFDIAIYKYIHEICLSTNNAQIVKITSGAKGEGKATIARAMALYYYKMGKSVVLVDGDFNHHSSSIWFGLNEQPGLMDYICGHRGLSDIIIRDKIPNLSFIPAGSHGSLDLKTLVLKPLTELFSILTSDYEKIIFVDAPFSCNQFILADMLPPHDIIIVVKSGEHSIDEVDCWTGMREFTKGNATLKGIVINKIIL
jgi:Mrp family chromosome partitioning ATPase